MKEEYYRWKTPYLSRSFLSRTFNMLVFGHQGQPLILFPPARGKFHTCRDLGLLDPLKELIVEGKLKVYCPDTIDEESWFHPSEKPSIKLGRHLAYERVLLQEVIKKAVYETHTARVILAGVGFGGFHAANLAFKHPAWVSAVVALEGEFHMRQLLQGYEAPEVYFNSPLDYMGGMQESEMLFRIRHQQIVLAGSMHHPSATMNWQLSEILNQKRIPHWYEAWQTSAELPDRWLLPLRNYLMRVVAEDNSG